MLVETMEDVTSACQFKTVFYTVIQPLLIRTVLLESIAFHSFQSKAHQNGMEHLTSPL